MPQTVLPSCLLCVSWLMVARPRLRTPTNYCLTSLAASDLLAGSVVIPLVLTCSCTLSTWTCVSMELCQRFLSTSTIFHLLVATLERYLKIRKPFAYPRLVTKKRLTAVLLGVWVFSLSMSLIQLLWINLSDAEEQEQARIRETDVIYTAIGLAVLVLAPFPVMLSAYVHMFIIIKREMRRRRKMMHRKRSREVEATQKRKKNERKVVVVYLFMSISFVLGWFPYFMLSLFDELLLVKPFMIPFWADCIMINLKFVTAFVNPVLYTFFKNDFQKALESLTVDRWCCTNKN